MVARYETGKMPAYKWLKIAKKWELVNLGGIEKYHKIMLISKMQNIRRFKIVGTDRAI